jgi:hypothetical protein
MGSPFPFYKSKGREWLEREREEREKSKRDPWDCAASFLRMGPTGPVDDDDGGVPMPCSGATCGVRSNRTSGAGLSGHRMGDVCPVETGGVSPRRVFQLDPQRGGWLGLAVIA